MQSSYNYSMRGGAYPPRYFYPLPVPPLLYQVELSVGGQQFNGKGKTRQAAKHDAAAKALRILQNEPPPERLEVNGRESEEENLNKSEISQVFEIALKRNLPVNFEVPFPGSGVNCAMQCALQLPVARESGPPHMKNFVTKVSVGEFVGEGEGKSKKISKKNAAIAVLEELKKLPPLPAVERVKPRIKKKTKPTVKLQASPEYGQAMNPISRLAQIQQAKKDKEPEYVLLTERGLPRRREFVMQVKVGNHTAEGAGTNKKVAKRNAAENMLEILGFKVPQAQPTKPALKSEEKSISVSRASLGGMLFVPWAGGCISEKAGCEHSGHKEDEFRMPYLSHQQLPAGILPMVPEVAQAVGVSQGHHTKDFTRAAPNPAKATVTAMIARELLYGGTSPTAETILKNNISSGHAPHGPLTRPSEQLDYLSRVQGFQTPVKKPGDGRKVTFFEPGSADENGTSHKEDEFRMPYLSHQQLPAGILPMVPEVAQAVGVSQGHHTKDFTRAAPNPAKATVTAMIARELLYGGTSPTAETILKNNISSGHAPHGPLTRPSEQLDYLSRVQGFQVEYKDFPKNNKNEFVSLINCSSQPPLISHGIGKDVESCHDMAALNILKLLSELDQQNSEMPRPGNGPMSV
ncbi:Double-stranded RNA-binding protein Staufen like protein 1 [Tupaia chinensis]|uniref:Double-stranded RNA-binding protein Staufen homolog 1 n=1 Tax=Tupaia chinensis TaxID=246437 RepID=L9LD94_TUPCH|nr:Double-stranded RNA-binding protein Staufen like protein 1 [Tupaia chinensis]